MTDYCHTSAASWLSSPDKRNVVYSEQTTRYTLPHSQPGSFIFAAGFEFTFDQIYRSEMLLIDISPDEDLKHNLT